MVQKTSPFIESKYGWDLGEGNWNTGMDENLIKFSFLFDSNIDGIVNTLPEGVNGKAYYLTTDKRVFYYINGVWASTPIPLWYELKLRTTGEILVYNGTTLLTLPSAAALDTELENIKVDVGLLAPIESPAFTGTPTAINNPSLDQPSSLATVSTILSAIGGLSVKVVDTLAQLYSTKTSEAKAISVMGYYSAGDGGGGVYYLDASDNTSADNGGTIIVATDGGRWKLVSEEGVSVKQFGAKGDGITDDTYAIQSCFTWAGTNVKKIFVPSVPVGYKLTSPININESINIVGENIRVASAITPSLNTKGAGSWFYLAHTGRGFVFNDGIDVVIRPQLSNIGTYRDQPTPVDGVDYIPTGHDYDFYFYNCDCTCRDFVTLNPTKGMVFTANPSISQSRADISGWRGHPLAIGLQIDFIADVVRVDNTHFWPYWAHHPKVTEYTLKNGVGIASYRNDNPMITRYFTFGYKNSIYIGTNALGSTAKMKLSVFDFDYFGVSGIFMDGTDASLQADLGVMQGYSSTEAANCIEFSAGSSGQRVSISNLDMGLTANNNIRVGGVANNTLRVGSGVRLYQWNGSGLGFGAIEVIDNNFAIIDHLPEFTAPLNGGLMFSPGGDVRMKTYVRPATYTTDLNGTLTLNHNIGKSPQSAFAMVNNGSTPISVQFVSATATTATFIARTTSTAAVLSDGSISCAFDVIF